MITVDDLSSLGPALKELRGHVRKTQGEVCDLAGIKSSQLSRWENGHEKPTLESVVKVLNALGRDLSDLQAVLAGSYLDEMMVGNRGAERRRQREERVRSAYHDAWRARSEVAALRAEGVLPIEDHFYAADREERAALIKLLTVTSGYFVDPKEGYFAHLSIEELWGHFRVLEHRFSDGVTAGIGEAPLPADPLAHERWGSEEIRRYSFGGDSRGESLAEQVDRLEDQLQAVEERLEDLESA